MQPSRHQLLSAAAGNEAGAVCKVLYENNQDGVQFVGQGAVWGQVTHLDILF